MPPFSVLDARQGYRRRRKRLWLKLGVQGELGRNESLLYSADEIRYFDYYRKQNKETHTNGPVRLLLEKAKRWKADNKKFGIIGGSPLPAMDYSQQARDQLGTSIFDPVLCELMYRWFCPNNGKILDPFAGESTKGIVAACLGYSYTGIELRKEQIKANQTQAKKIGLKPRWIRGDANSINKLIDKKDKYDFVLTSPPYFNLEVYSKKSKDGSTIQTYKEFMEWYFFIFKKMVRHLRKNRFLVVKVGEIRDKKTGAYHNFVGDNISCFLDLGLVYYNEIILVTAIGSLPVRAGRQFASGRKIGKTHQNILVFYKGNPKNIKQHFPQEGFNADFA